MRGFMGRNRVRVGGGVGGLVPCRDVLYRRCVEGGRRGLVPRNARCIVLDASNGLLLSSGFVCHFRASPLVGTNIILGGVQHSCPFVLSLGQDSTVRIAPT